MARKTDKHMRMLLGKLENSEFRTAVANGKAVDWLIANHGKLSDMDTCLLSSIITSEERYAVMEGVYNKEHDARTSLFFRDSQNIVPYFLSNLSRFTCRDDYEESLLDVWITGEYGQFLPEDWNEAFLAANPEKLRAAGNTIPKKVIRKDGKITVYQGGNAGGDCRYNSWTISKSVAIRFAWLQWRQFDEYGSFLGYLVYSNPTVYKATVSVDDIWMYTNRREEQEVVVKTERIPTQVEIVMEWDRDVDSRPILKAG